MKISNKIEDKYDIDIGFCILTGVIVGAVSCFLLIPIPYFFWSPLSWLITCCFVFPFMFTVGLVLRLCSDINKEKRDQSMDPPKHPYYLRVNIHGKEYEDMKIKYESDLKSYESLSLFRAIDRMTRTELALFLLKYTFWPFTLAKNVVDCINEAVTPVKKVFNKLLGEKN